MKRMTKFKASKPVGLYQKPFEPKKSNKPLTEFIDMKGQRLLLTSRRKAAKEREKHCLNIPSLPAKYMSVNQGFTDS